MARPAKVEVSSASPGWDSSLSANLETIFDGPLPVYRGGSKSTIETNFPADQYEDCIAIDQSTSRILISDGSTWEYLVPILPYDGAPTATTLRDALITAGLMAAS